MRTFTLLQSIAGPFLASITGAQLRASNDSDNQQVLDTTVDMEEERNGSATWDNQDNPKLRNIANIHTIGQAQHLASLFEKLTGIQSNRNNLSKDRPPHYEQQTIQGLNYERTIIVDSSSLSPTALFCTMLLDSTNSSIELLRGSPELTRDFLHALTVGHKASYTTQFLSLTKHPDSPEPLPSLERFLLTKLLGFDVIDEIKPNTRPDSTNAGRKKIVGADAQHLNWTSGNIESVDPLPDTPHPATNHSLKKRQEIFKQSNATQLFEDYLNHAVADTIVGELPLRPQFTILELPNLFYLLNPSLLDKEVERIECARLVLDRCQALLNTKEAEWTTALQENKEPLLQSIAELHLSYEPLVAKSSREDYPIQASLEGGINVTTLTTLNRKIVKALAEEANAVKQKRANLANEALDLTQIYLKSFSDALITSLKKMHTELPRTLVFKTEHETLAEIIDKYTHLMTPGTFTLSSFRSYIKLLTKKLSIFNNLPHIHPTLDKLAKGLDEVKDNIENMQRALQSSASTPDQLFTYLAPLASLQETVLDNQSRIRAVLNRFLDALTEASRHIIDKEERHKLDTAKDIILDSLQHKQNISFDSIISDIVGFISQDKLLELVPTIYNSKRANDELTPRSKILLAKFITKFYIASIQTISSSTEALNHIQKAAQCFQSSLGDSLAYVLSSPLTTDITQRFQKLNHLSAAEKHLINNAIKLYFSGSARTLDELFQNLIIDLPFTEELTTEEQTTYATRLKAECLAYCEPQDTHQKLLLIENISRAQDTDVTLQDKYATEIKQIKLLGWAQTIHYLCERELQAVLAPEKTTTQHRPRFQSEAEIDDARKIQEGIQQRKEQAINLAMTLTEELYHDGLLLEEVKTSFNELLELGKNNEHARGLQVKLAATCKASIESFVRAEQDYQPILLDVVAKMARTGALRFEHQSNRRHSSRDSLSKDSSISYTYLVSLDCFMLTNHHSPLNPALIAEAIVFIAPGLDINDKFTLQIFELAIRFQSTDLLKIVKDIFVSPTNLGSKVQAELNSIDPLFIQAPTNLPSSSAPMAARTDSVKIPKEILSESKRESENPDMSPDRSSIYESRYHALPDMLKSMIARPSDHSLTSLPLGDAEKLIHIYDQIIDAGFSQTSEATFTNLVDTLHEASLKNFANIIIRFQKAAPSFNTAEQWMEKFLISEEFAHQCSERKAIAEVLAPLRAALWRKIIENEHKPYQLKYAPEPICYPPVYPDATLLDAIGGSYAAKIVSRVATYKLMMHLVTLKPGPIQFTFKAHDNLIFAEPAIQDEGYAVIQEGYLDEIIHDCTEKFHLSESAITNQRYFPTNLTKNDFAKALQQHFQFLNTEHKKINNFVGNHWHSFIRTDAGDFIDFIKAIYRHDPEHYLLDDTKLAQEIIKNYKLLPRNNHSHQQTLQSALVEFVDAKLHYFWHPMTQPIKSSLKFILEHMSSKNNSLITSIQPIKEQLTSALVNESSIQAITQPVVAILNIVRTSIAEGVLPDDKDQITVMLITIKEQINNKHNKTLSKRDNHTKDKIIKAIDDTISETSNRATPHTEKLQQIIKKLKWVLNNKARKREIIEVFNELLEHIKNTIPEKQLPAQKEQLVELLIQVEGLYIDKERNDQENLVNREIKLFLTKYFHYCFGKLRNDFLSALSKKIHFFEDPKGTLTKQTIGLHLNLLLIELAQKTVHEQYIIPLFSRQEGHLWDPEALPEHSPKGYYNVIVHEIGLCLKDHLHLLYLPLFNEPLNDLKRRIGNCFKQPAPESSEQLKNQIPQIFNFDIVKKSIVKHAEKGELKASQKTVDALETRLHAKLFINTHDLLRTTGIETESAIGERKLEQALIHFIGNHRHYCFGALGQQLIQAIRTYVANIDIAQTTNDQVEQDLIDITDQIAADRIDELGLIAGREECNWHEKDSYLARIRSALTLTVKDQLHHLFLPGSPAYMSLDSLKDISRKTLAKPEPDSDAAFEETIMKKYGRPLKGILNQNSSAQREQAIFQATAELKSHPENIKLLKLLSDWRALSDSYNGTAHSIRLFANYTTIQDGIFQLSPFSPETNKPKELELSDLNISSQKHINNFAQEWSDISNELGHIDRENDFLRQLAYLYRIYSLYPEGNILEIITNKIKEHVGNPQLVMTPTLANFVIWATKKMPQEYQRFSQRQVFHSSNSTTKKSLVEFRGKQDRKSHMNFMHWCIQCDKNSLSPNIIISSLLGEAVRKNSLFSCAPGQQVTWPFFFEEHNERSGTNGTMILTVWDKQHRNAAPLCAQFCIIFGEDNPEVLTIYRQGSPANPDNLRTAINECGTDLEKIRLTNSLKRTYETTGTFLGEKHTPQTETPLINTCTKIIDEILGQQTFQDGTLNIAPIGLNRDSFFDLLSTVDAPLDEELEIAMLKLSRTDGNHPLYLRKAILNIFILSLKHKETSLTDAILNRWIEGSKNALSLSTLTVSTLKAIVENSTEQRKQQLTEEHIDNAAISDRVSKYKLQLLCSLHLLLMYTERFDLQETLQDLAKPLGVDFTNIYINEAALLAIISMDTLPLDASDLLELINCSDTDFRIIATTMRDKWKRKGSNNQAAILLSSLCSPATFELVTTLNEEHDNEYIIFLAEHEDDHYAQLVATAKKAPCNGPRWNPEFEDFLINQFGYSKIERLETRDQGGVTSIFSFLNLCKRLPDSLATNATDNTIKTAALQLVKTPMGSLKHLKAALQLYFAATPDLRDHVSRYISENYNLTLSEPLARCLKDYYCKDNLKPREQAIMDTYIKAGLLPGENLEDNNTYSKLCILLDSIKEKSRNILFKIKSTIEEYQETLKEGVQPNARLSVALTKTLTSYQGPTLSNEKLSKISELAYNYQENHNNSDSDIYGQLFSAIEDTKKWLDNEELKNTINRHHIEMKDIEELIKKHSETYTQRGSHEHLKLTCQLMVTLLNCQHPVLIKTVKDDIFRLFCAHLQYQFNITNISMPILRSIEDVFCQLDPKEEQLSLAVLRLLQLGVAVSNTESGISFNKEVVQLNLNSLRKLSQRERRTLTKEFETVYNYQKTPVKRKEALIKLLGSNHPFAEDYSYGLIYAFDRTQLDSKISHHQYQRLIQFYQLCHSLQASNDLVMDDVSMDISAQHYDNDSDHLAVLSDSANDGFANDIAQSAYRQAVTLKLQLQLTQLKERIHSDGLSLTANDKKDISLYIQNYLDCNPSDETNPNLLQPICLLIYKLCDERAQKQQTDLINRDILTHHLKSHFSFKETATYTILSACYTLAETQGNQPLTDKVLKVLAAGMLVTPNNKAQADYLAQSTQAFIDLDSLASWNNTQLDNWITSFNKRESSSTLNGYSKSPILNGVTHFQDSNNEFITPIKSSSSSEKSYT